MNSRERVIRTLKQEEVDRLPRNLWFLPGVGMFRGNEMKEVLDQYPQDFSGPVYHYGKGKRCKGELGIVGEYTDAWGCVWHAGEPGVVGEVKEYPLADWSNLDDYQVPWEILKEADLTGVNEGCANTDKFVLAGTETRPFERMQFLRGTENLFMDLACEVDEVYRLRDMLHEFNINEMKMWAQTDVDGVSFMDDWGSQNALLISPALWRKFYKPLYKDYCDILHSKGKYAFMHSDGFIESIYPDLVEIGVDAINSQLFCMDIEKLGRQYAGKIAFWGEIDRQHLLPFGSPQEVRDAVDRVASAFIKGKRTGVIAECEWGTKDPRENIEAVFERWLDH